MTWPLVLITVTTLAGFGAATTVLIAWPRDPGIIAAGLLTTLAIEWGPLLAVEWVKTPRHRKATRLDTWLGGEQR